MTPTSCCETCGLLLARAFYTMLFGWEAERVCTGTQLPPSFGIWINIYHGRMLVSMSEASVHAALTPVLLPESPQPRRSRPVRPSGASPAHTHAHARTHTHNLRINTKTLTLQVQTGKRCASLMRRTGYVSERTSTPAALRAATCTTRGSESANDPHIAWLRGLQHLRGREQ